MLEGTYFSETVTTLILPEQELGYLAMPLLEESMAAHLSLSPLLFFSKTPIQCSVVPGQSARASEAATMLSNSEMRDGPDILFDCPATVCFSVRLLCFVFFHSASIWLQKYSQWLWMWQLLLYIFKA